MTNDLHDNPAAGDSQRLSASGKHLPPPPHVHKKSRTLLWTVIGLACVAAGIVIGASIAVIFVRNNFMPRPPEPQEMTQRILEHMDRVASLSPEEKEKITALVSVHMEEIQRIRKNSFAAIGKEFTDMRSEVREIIGQQRYDKWREEVEKNRPKHPPHKKDKKNPQPKHDKIEKPE